MLHPKTGDRAGMKTHVRAQFDSAGVEPVDGMVVVLVDERGDIDDEGITCDIAAVVC